MRRKFLFALLAIFILSNSPVHGQHVKGSKKRSDVFYVVVHKPGELSKSVPKKLFLTIRKMKVKGSLSNDDVRFLRNLAERQILKDTLGNRLEPFFDIDLEEATILESSLFARKNISVIPNGFMHGGKLLRSIVLPANTESIKADAFSQCENLLDVWIPMGVKKIERSAFQGCESLSMIKLPRTLESIGAYCFKDCKRINRINIPHSVIVISAGTFSNTGIEFLEFHERISKVDASAFNGCDKLQNIFVSPENPFLCDIDGMLANKQKSQLIRVPQGKGGVLNVPDGIEQIGDYAMEGCARLTEVVLPSSVNIIGRGAFRGCRNLRKINLPNNITNLADYMFAGCINLTSIALPLELRTIGKGVFANCGLVSMDLSELELDTIPSSLLEGCSNLVFFNWPKGTKSIGESVFKGCSKLQSVSIPGTVSSIGTEAFRGCNSFQTFEFPLSISSLGRKVLYDCKNLQQVICHWDTPVEVKDVSNNKKAVLSVPTTAVGLYKEAKGWKKFKEIVPIK